MSITRQSSAAKTLVATAEPALGPHPGRRERRRAETRERIYRAAMQLFARRGFFETTTEDITEAADVGQGTFFNYFPTKQHVLVVLSEKQLAKAAATRDQVRSGTASVRGALQRLMHAVAEEPCQTRALARSLITALVSSDIAREFAGTRMAQGRELVSEVMLIGQGRGEIRLDRAPGDLALALQRTFWGATLLWAIQSKGDLHAWLDKAFEDFWAAAEVRDQVERRRTDGRRPGFAAGVRKRNEERYDRTKADRN
jgi:AcrR family transcriptional regulator